MRGGLTRCAPLAASLLGHAAVLAALAAPGLVGVGSPPPVVAVRRAPDRDPAPRLQLVSAGGDAAGPAGDGAVVPLDSPDARYRDYLSAVKRRIWERWSGPDTPPGPAARGTLLVEFTLTRSGRLAGSGVLEPSGTPALDRAALAAVAGAIPFAPLPASIAGDTLRIRARFTYD